MGSPTHAHVNGGTTPSGTDGSPAPDEAPATSGPDGSPESAERPETSTTSATADERAEGSTGPGTAGTLPGWRRTISDRMLALIVGAVTLPLLWMGYGTDIDVANVLDTVDRIHDGGYRPSRTPGVPVFEGVVAVLDPVGGHILVNLATAAAAAATVVGLARLVRAWGHANGDLIALAFLASPITLIASSSVGDFVWALCFLVWGALVHLRAPAGSTTWLPWLSRRRAARQPAAPARADESTRPDGAGANVGTLVGTSDGEDREQVQVTSDGDGDHGAAGARGVLTWLRQRDPSLGAGVLFGLAAGARLSTGFLVAAFLVADGWEPAHRRRCLRSVLYMVPVAIVVYVPSWLSFDRSLAFLETNETYRGFANNLGRFVYKNYAAAGPVLLVVLLVAVPALVAALRRWKVDPLLRFGVLVFVVSEALYFQLPLKVAHLLPALMALVLWLAATRRNQRPFLWLVIGALVVNGLVSFRLLAPDDAHNAREARWDPSIGTGLLVNDIDCRLKYMDEPPARYQNAAWNCTLEPVRTPTSE